ncbi:MAG: Do family serine endopeptidase [Candidatus Caldatribacteriota bacterium]
MKKNIFFSIKQRLIVVTFLIFLLFLVNVPIINAESNPEGTSFSLEELSDSIAKIAEEVGPAVVNIDTVRMVQTGYSFFDDPFFRQFFGDQFQEYTRTIPQKGTGSGFIISEEGYIFTNQHVVYKADKIKVTLSDGREFEGEVVGEDMDSDMAIVKIKADNLPVVQLGDSDQLRVGEIVIAIGNPYGLAQTVTMGVISAKDRSISTEIEGHSYNNLIQTDTAINPGNSGGPLINTKGEVVGINTAIIPYAQGIGFAIPINIAKRNIDDLIQLGHVRTPWIGVYIQEVTPEIAQYFNLTKAQGVLVADVVENTPAEKAGIKRGDIIIKVNHQEVNSSLELQNKIRSLKIGEIALLEVLRNGKELSFEMKVEEKPASEGQSSEPGKEQVFSVQTGLKVEPVTQEIAKEVGLPWVKGLVITEVLPGSSADDRGLRRGDIILEANHKEVSSLEEWRTIVNSLEEGDTLLLLVFRNQHTYYVPIKVEKID